MSKFIFIFLKFFLLFGLLSAAARNPQDTSVLTINRDSSTAFESDSVSADGNTYDSAFLPARDTLVSFPGTIRRVSKKQMDRYKNGPEYAYANDPEYWLQEPLHKPGLLFRILNSRTTLWIFLIVIAILILYGVYQLALENNFTMLIRARRPKTEDTELAMGSGKVNFDEVIKIHQAEGNYRMATRFLYLRLIHLLREKNGISFGDSSTNAEITRAFGDHPGAATFRWLATAYEYVYYGEFVPNQEKYFLLKNKFDAFQKIFSD